MKAAIIGCGMMGKAHAKAYEDLGHQVTAVCDVNLQSAQNVADCFDTCAYADIAAMLENESIDIASICTPAFNHLDSLKALCKAKVPTLCEKPFMRNNAEAVEAFRLVKEAGIPFRLGFKMRYESVYAAAEKIVRSGEIGALRYVFISHFQPMSDPAWYMDVGVATELLVHPMDIACWLFNETPQSVLMKSEYLLQKGGEDQARIELNFSAHRQAIIAGGYMKNYPPCHGKHDFVFQFVGENGYVCGKRNSTIEIFSPKRIELLRPEDANAFALEIADFILAAQGKQAGGATLEDALCSQSVLTAVKKAEKTGKYEKVEVSRA